MAAGRNSSKKSPKLISIPLKAKKKGGKTVYETNEAASDEQRRIFRLIQRRQVEVNLSLSWDGVKRPQKRNSEELVTSETESKEDRRDCDSCVDPAKPSRPQNLEVSSMVSERNLIEVPIKRSVDHDAQSIWNEKHLKMTSARNENFDDTLINKSVSSDGSKRTKVAHDDDDIVEVTLDRVNSSSLDDIVAKDDDGIEVVFEKKAQVGCAFCDVFFPNYRQLMLHTARLHKQDAVKSPATTPGIQCAFCTKGFFDSINLMKHVALDHPQPGKETIVNPKTDGQRKESGQSLDIKAKVMIDSNANDLRDNLNFLPTSVEPKKMTTLPPTTTRDAKSSAVASVPMMNCLTTSIDETSKMTAKGNAGDVFQCNHCSFHCTSVEDLLRHNTATHSKKREQKKVYLCPFCPFIARFRYKTRWQLHFDESHSEALKRSEASGKYECLICRKMDSSRLGLNRHILEAHAETTVVDSRLDDAKSTSSESQNVDHSTVNVSYQ